MRITLLFCTLFVFSAYSQDTNTVSCQIVVKNFEKKNGEKTSIEELYLRCSVQDYFIKICESDVSREDLEKYIDSGITVQLTIEDGAWDKCADDPHEVQSRIGHYAVIHSMESLSKD